MLQNILIQNSVVSLKVEKQQGITENLGLNLDLPSLLWSSVLNYVKEAQQSLPK